MDGNKDEALRSVNLAKSAFASGDRPRAEKFIRIARRLDPCVPLDDLLSATEKSGILNDATCHDKTGRGQAPEIPEAPKNYAGNYVDHGYTEENVRLVRDIRKKKDYYAILGVERRCSGEEIKKAYRRLSLKVHPDKNKAPGAEDAFKLVSRAFNCLSNDQSRKTYDQTGNIEDHEFSEQYSSAMRRGPVRRRRQARSSFYSYEDMLGRYCHVELQRRQWAKNYPTPHCDKLRSTFSVA